MRTGPRAVRIKVAADQGENLPGLRLRTYKVGSLQGAGGYHSSDYVDVAVAGVRWNTMFRSGANDE